MSNRLFPCTSPCVSLSLSAFVCESVFWKVSQLLREVVCSRWTICFLSFTSCSVSKSTIATSVEKCFDLRFFERFSHRVDKCHDLRISECDVKGFTVPHLYDCSYLSIGASASKSLRLSSGLLISTFYRVSASGVHKCRNLQVCKFVASIYCFHLLLRFSQLLKQ